MNLLQSTYIRTPTFFCKLRGCLNKLMRFVFLLERIYVRIFNELMYYTDAVGGFIITTTPIQGSESCLRFSVGGYTNDSNTQQNQPWKHTRIHWAFIKQLHKQYIINIYALQLITSLSSQLAINKRPLYSYTWKAKHITVTIHIPSYTIHSTHRLWTRLALIHKPPR